MSVFRWRYDETCEGRYCCGDCDKCDKEDEPVDDLISRQAAIKQILLCENHDMEHDFEFNHGLIVAMNAVEELPTANPSTTLMKVEVGVDKESLRKAMEKAELTLVAEPRKGKWERHYSRPNVYADLFWHCSECGYKNDENYAPVYHHFCPNCGARMEDEHMANLREYAHDFGVTIEQAEEALRREE